MIGRARRLLPLLLVLVAPGAQGALRLPIRHYTSADGLTQDDVYRMVFDGEGFLWIGTGGGLCRFDGEQFSGFGTADGLRGRVVHDIALGTAGTHWVATEAGLFAFRPGEIAAPGKAFQEIPLAGVPERDQPFRLLADRSGALWVGTLERLWRVTPSGGGYLATPVSLPGLDTRVQSLAEDAEGAIWIGTHASGVYRMGAGGHIDHYPVDRPGANFVRDFHFAKDGSVWMTYFGGVAIFDGPPFGTPIPAVRLFGSAEGMEIDTGRMLPLEEDRVVVTTSVGLIEMHRSGPRSKDWQVGPTLDRRSGLPTDSVVAIARDASGNLWLSVFRRGLVELVNNGLSTVPDFEGSGSHVVNLTTDRQGRLIVLAARGAKALTVYQPEGNPPGPFSVSLPANIEYVGWGGGQKMLIDHLGAWWIATGDGVLRFDDPHRLGPRRLEHPPDAVYGMREGLPGKDVFVLREDGGGDIWISSNNARAGASTVSRWSRTTGKIEGFPATTMGTSALAVRFFPTRDGSLWIRFVDDTLVRMREGTVQTTLRGADFRELLEDAAGRLWWVGDALKVAPSSGAERPSFVPVEVPGTEEGVGYQCAVEGGDGLLWLGTTQGIVAYSPDTRQVRRLTIEDGLVGNSIVMCERDASGALWFSDSTGLSKLVPRPSQRPVLPRARLREIRVAGEAVLLPSSGTSEVGPLRIPHDRRRLSVDFFAVHAGSGPPFRFQYRLEGSDREWSAPSRSHQVQYAHLTPGRYRFLVRTVNEDGVSASAPASLALEVLAPVWQRAWFLALCLSAAAGIAYSVHRVRVARAISLERMRTRIATDLHDDVGTSLSQIAILSQLAPRRPELQQRITALAGEVIDAMSDVVWAISPRWDTVSALTHRMRRFASELFADDAAVLDLALPAETEQRIDPEVRRQIYLVFKEALHNVRRHAGARRVRVTLALVGGEWTLTVEEDGRGFDPERESAGHGLTSMRQRAERLGGRLSVASSPEGTRLTLCIPSGPRRNLWNR